MMIGNYDIPLLVSIGEMPPYFDSKYALNNVANFDVRNPDPVTQAAVDAENAREAMRWVQNRLEQTKRWPWVGDEPSSGVVRRAQAPRENGAAMRAYVRAQQARIPEAAERSPVVTSLQNIAYVKALEEQRKRHLGRDMNTLTGTF